MALNKLPKRDAHLLLNSDRVVDMATDAEEFGARILVTAEAIEPVGSTAHDSRAYGHGLDICHRRRAAVQTSVGWEGRLQTRATGLAFERLDERGLFSTDVSASTAVHNHIEVIATAASILADHTLRVGFIDSSLQLELLIPKLTSHVDVGGLGAHSEANNKGSFDELVRVVT